MIRNATLFIIAGMFVCGSQSHGQDATSRSSGIQLPAGVKTGVNTFVDKKRGTSVSVVIPQPTQVYRGNRHYVDPRLRYRSNFYGRPYYPYPVYRSTYPYPYTYSSPYVYYPGGRYYGRGYYYGVVPGVSNIRSGNRTNSNNPFGGTSHYFGNPHASQYMGR